MTKLVQVIAIVLAIPACAFAQTTNPVEPDDLGPMPRGNVKEWNARGWATANSIAENLSANDSAETRRSEMARIKMLLRARLAFVTKNNTLPGLLLYKKMEAELIELADYGTACHPEQTDDVARLQKYKAKALLALGRREECLAAAKAYFNVAPMSKTADSVKLLADILSTVDADPTGRAAAFKAEQIAGAEPVAADKLKEPQPRTGVLESIKIDPSPYEEALAKRATVSYAQLTGKGNLLLLADRADEALKAFEAAQAFASEKLAAEATENMARAMRAADGSIGRANAWLDSLHR